MLTDQIEKSLDLTDTAKKDRIATVVHNRIQALEDDIIEAKASGMAQVYSIDQLDGALAFDRSPTGQALRGAAPELNRELASVVFGRGALAADGPTLSEQKVALINRVLKARDIEPDARKGWRLLGKVMTAALSEPAKSAAPTATSAKDQAAEDDYVKLVVAVETQFYAKNFSDEQLTEIANYFEGPIGRAIVQRAPQLTSFAASAVPKIFEQQLERMDSEACDAVDCTAPQRAALDTQFSQIRLMMSAGINAVVR